MKNALISLGYRETRQGVFAKPVAFNFLTFETKTNLWTNWLIGKNGQTLIHDSDTYDEEKHGDFLDFIKCSESFTKYYSLPSNFEFLSMEEQLKDLLG